MNMQEVFNLILSRLECSEVDYKVISDAGKTVICINCNDGIARFIVDTK